MKTKHPVRLFVLSLFWVMIVAIGVSVFVTIAADARRHDNLNEQLLLGVHYLAEMNYEAP